MDEPKLVTMTFPNGGTAKVEAYVFADMLCAYQNALYDRQKEAKGKLTEIDLGDPDDRRDRFQRIVNLYDDAEGRLRIIEQVDSTFRTDPRSK